MSKELIEQLRDLANCRHDDLSIGYEAADRIEELEKERDLHRNRLASLLFSDYFKPEVTAGMIQELADEYINALAERDQLREQVKLLRDALMRIAVDDCECGAPCDCYSWASMSDTASKALAATEQNP